MQSRDVLLLLTIGMMSAGGCRSGDDPTPVEGNGGRDGQRADGGFKLDGDCPVEADEALSVCDLKNPQSPRQPMLGDDVEVVAVATTAPFSLTQTATSGLNGFFIQDEASNLAGRYAGIIVTYFADAQPTLPRRGDRVRISGTLRDFGQDGFARQIQIALTDLTIEGTGTISPQLVSAETIATSGADPVAYEGTLVEIQNVEALVVQDVPGSNGSTIFGAFQVTGGLVVRNTLADVRADPGETFARIAGILRVGTAPFDAGVYALNPRDTSDVETLSEGIGSIVELQDPGSAGRPAICTQRGGANTRSGVCPRVRLRNVVISATAPATNGRVSMFVQDDGVGDGRFAGVRVFNARIEGPGTPEVGARVDVEGLAVLFFDGLQIAEGTVSLTGESAALNPVTVRATDIPGDPSLMNGEVVSPYEGVLVQLENVEVTQTCIDSNGDRGYFEVAGAVIVGSEFDYAYNGGPPPDSAEPPPCGAMGRTDDRRAVGDRFQRIAGVMDYSFGQFRLNPRSDADIEGP